MDLCSNSAASEDLIMQTILCNQKDWITGDTILCIEYVNGETVRYQIDCETCDVWMTGYGMEESYEIVTEFSVGEHLVASDDYESVEDAVNALIARYADVA